MKLHIPILLKMRFPFNLKSQGRRRKEGWCRRPCRPSSREKPSGTGIHVHFAYIAQNLALLSGYLFPGTVSPRSNMPLVFNTNCFWEHNKSFSVCMLRTVHGIYKYRVFVPFWVLLRFADLEPEMCRYAKQRRIENRANKDFTWNLHLLTTYDTAYSMVILIPQRLSFIQINGRTGGTQKVLTFPFLLCRTA